MERSKERIEQFLVFSFSYPPKARMCFIYEGLLMYIITVCFPYTISLHWFTFYHIFSRQS